MFDFRMQVFNTVAKRLSFTKAAEELYITQPAVTRHVHEIEKYFKIKLFERNGNKIKLTAAGDTLLQYTEQLFALYNNLEFELNGFSKRHAGKLRIGASTTVAQYVLPPVLAAFHKKFADIHVTLAINNTDQIEQSLLNKNIDLGVIEGKSKNNLFKYTQFVKDELVLVAGNNHPLTKKKYIKPNELLKIPLLLREPGSGTLEVIAHALKPFGIKMAQLQTEMQMGSTESMKLYLLNSDAMAFLSIHAILKELQNKDCSVLTVKGLKIERDFFFIQQHGEGETLPDLFMKFALRYNFR